MPAASNALSTIDSAQPQTFEIRPFSGAVGAELIGLDLARPVSWADITRAEQTANAIVWQNQPVSIRFVSAAEATTLPMRIYSQVRLGVSPQINAISTLLLGLYGDEGKIDFVGHCSGFPAPVRRELESPDPQAPSRAENKTETICRRAT